MIELRTVVIKRVLIENDVRSYVIIGTPPIVENFKLLNVKKLSRLDAVKPLYLLRSE